MRQWLTFILLFTALLLTACGETPTPDVEATVQAAVEATQAAQPTATPRAPTDTTLPPTTTATPVPATVTPRSPTVTVTVVTPVATLIPPTAEPQEAAPSSPTPIPVAGLQQLVSLPCCEMAVLGDPGAVSQEGGQPGNADRVNIAFILDASGSMNAELPGTGQTRLAVAKQVMAELIPQIPVEVNGALWIYGHRYPQEPQSDSCKDIERAFSLGPVESAAYQQKTNALVAIGYTPIADSIAQAARDLPKRDLNSIILVSDGEETCGGDPCALAEALKASEAKITIHVVGYAVEEVARDQLACIARVSGGSYHDAEDAAGLLRALGEAMTATVSETVLRVELVDPDLTEVRDTVYLYEAGTDRLMSGYTTWQDNAVPPGIYDLLAPTEPQVVFQQLDLEENSTTIVRIALSAIKVLTPEGEVTRFDLLDPATDDWLSQESGTTILLPGTYKVGVNDIAGDPIVLNAGETEEIWLGALKVFGPDGEDVRFDLLDPATNDWLSQETRIVFLLPGTYKVGVNGVTGDPITLDAGQTQEIQLGTLKVLGPDGEDARFDLLDPATNDWLSQETGDVFLLPGTYKVGVNGTNSDPITLDAGQTQEIRLGALKVLGPDGADARFDLLDPVSGGWLGQKSGLIFLLPGSYRVEAANGSTFEDVVVTAGQVTELK